MRLPGDIAARRDPPEASHAHSHSGLGTLYAKLGQQQPAHAELSAAIGLSRAMDMTFWLPQTLVAMETLGEHGGSPRLERASARRAILSQRVSRTAQTYGWAR